MAILISVYRNRKTIQTDRIDLLKDDRPETGKETPKVSD